MTFEPDTPPTSDGLPRRWPLSLPMTVALVAGAAVLMGGATLLLRPGAEADTGSGPTIAIAHRDAPQPDIIAGEKMDVMSTVVDGFDGVPERPEDAYDPWDDDSWKPGAEVDFQEPLPPPPRPMAVAEVTPPPPPVRRYRSDGRKDCSYARTRAEAMVCRDGRLAEIDDQMARAFVSAMDRADEPRRVMRDQQRWERARENAAIDGPEAVEDVYRQRMAELDF